MSVEWFKNFVGFKLDDAQMKHIPNPTLELMLHVTIKNIQAFGMMGTLLVGPIAAIVQRASRNIGAIVVSATRCGKWGATISIITGPLMTYGRLSTAKVAPEGIYDRCYRLRNNCGQVRVDRASVAGAVGGTAIASAVGSCMLFGGLAGMSAGIIAMAVYNSTIEKKKKN